MANWFSQYFCSSSRKKLGKALSQEQMPWPNLSSFPLDHKGMMYGYDIILIPAMFLLDKMKIILADPNNFDLHRRKTAEIL